MTGAAARTERIFVQTALGQAHVVSVRPARAARRMAFIHQVPSSHLMWRAVMDRLAAMDTACVAVDLPGFGFSEAPPEPPSIEEYGRAAAAALSPLLDGSCLVAGHHFGCVVALEVANQEPSLVHAVAGYGIPLVSEERRRMLATEEFERLGADGEEVSAYWRARRARGGASRDVEHSRRSLLEWLLAGDHAVWGHRAVGEYDTAAGLRRLQQPLLGLAGQQEDLYEETLRAAGEASDGRFQSLGSAGIDVADTGVDELCQALVEFDDASRSLA